MNSTIENKMEQRNVFKIYYCRRKKDLSWCEWNFNSLLHKISSLSWSWKMCNKIIPCDCIDHINAMDLPRYQYLVPKYQTSYCSVIKCKDYPVLGKKK